MTINFVRDDFGSDRLKGFATFALSKASQNQAAGMTGKGYEVGNAKVTASRCARSKKHPTAKAQNAASINNAVRDALVAGLLWEFNAKNFGDLPEQVRKALKGTYAKTAKGDFGFVNGMSASGKPLTKRRITAVLKAVKDCEGKIKSDRGAYFGDCDSLLY